MRELEKHIYFRDTIVVGGSLPALLYAYTNSLPIIFADGKPPFEFDELDEGTDLRFLGMDPESPATQLQVWNRLIFLLGLAGLMPLTGLAENIRIKEKQLFITTTHSRLIKINFNKLVIFDDEKVFGLTQVAMEKRGKNRIIDWVNVRSGCSHAFDSLDGDDEFVKKVVFYPTKRSDNKSFKDLFAISYLTDEQLKDFNFSDTMVKFKVLDMMKKAGIRGTRNGRNPLYPARSTVPYKYYALKIEPSERKVYPNIVRHYEPDERFEFCHSPLEELVIDIKKPEGYLGKLCEAF
jgi:hypothetical protein